MIWIDLLLVASGLLTAPLVSSLPSVLFLLVIGNETGKVAQARIQAKQQLHETRQALGETEQRLELALAAGQLGWWKWNAARDEFWMGDATRRLLHVALDQQLDRGWLRSCLHPDDRSKSSFPSTTSASAGAWSARHPCSARSGPTCRASPCWVSFRLRWRMS